MAKNNKKNQGRQVLGQHEKETAVELQGTIEEALPGTLFKVKCENEHMVLATLSGKLRMNHIRLVPGDFVTLEVSPYDLTRGRITWRR
jgi:translation initiation factor IF-1